jgi:16S rRNA A1518/A1519 N6-dimethyltransferase RsmA/KsgA/DIM1 with predicted DNA glycosylase/AP lyase activity
VERFTGCDPHGQRFARLAGDDSKSRVVSAFNLFQTPEPLAARVVEMAGELGRTLEPSAGLGRLYRAVRARSGCHVTLVEQSAECCAELYRETAGDGACKLVQGDFLSAEGLGLFDNIVMNESAV